MSRLFDQEWRKISLYLVSILVLGALLAPWLYLFGKEIVREGWLAANPMTQSIHDSMERAKFPRYFNRAIMIVALLGLIPLVRSLRFEGWKDLQIGRNRCAVMDVIAGVLLGAGFLLFMGAGFLYMGLFHPETDPNWGAIPSIIASALAVGILEEIFFRGAILGVCLRSMKTWSAVLITSLIYAIVHFLKPPKGLDLANVEWHTGFKMIGHALMPLANVQSFLGEFVTLVVVGAVLAIVRLRTRSLWLPIGLHIGWVFGLKLFGEVTAKSAGLGNWSPWVGDDLKIGLIPLVVVFITGAFASLWIDVSRKPVFPDHSEAA